MKNHLQFGRFRFVDAPLFLHWSAIAIGLLLLLISLRQPIVGLILMMSYFGILLIHEIGHALVARKLNAKVYSIRIGFLHGLCEYEEPYTEWDNLLIAWGGVLAQLSVAIPLIALSFVVSADYYFVRLPILVLGYINLAIALFNLLPIKGFDGEIAWKIIPHLIARKK